MAYHDEISKINKIRKVIPLSARYEQLAEEASELAQAALKKSRKLRGENYTPKSMEEIDKALEEEVTDVDLCLDVLNLAGSSELRSKKLDRWINRNLKDNNE